MAYMTLAEQAKELRQTLKSKLGLNARAVSVRKSNSGGAIYVEIHDPSANKDQVEEFARKYESYDRDHVTGEILCGGNTFVFVEWSDKAKAAVLESKAEVIENIKAVAIDENRSTVVRDTEGLDIFYGSNGWAMQEHSDAMICGFMGAVFRPEYPKSVALALLNVGKAA